jgi:hypothetical protein
MATSRKRSGESQIDFRCYPTVCRCAGRRRTALPHAAKSCAFCGGDNGSKKLDEAAIVDARGDVAWILSSGIVAPARTAAASASFIHQTPTESRQFNTVLTIDHRACPKAASHRAANTTTITKIAPSRSISIMSSSLSAQLRHTVTKMSIKDDFLLDDLLLRIASSRQVHAVVTVEGAPRKIRNDSERRHKNRSRPADLKSLGRDMIYWRVLGKGFRIANVDRLIYELGTLHQKARS